MAGRDGLPLLEVEAGERALLVPLLIEAACFFSSNRSMDRGPRSNAGVVLSTGAE